MVKHGIALVQAGIFVEKERRTLKTLFAILLFAICSFGQTSINEVKQEAPKCIHDTDESFYDNIRHSGAVQLTHSDGRTLTIVTYKKSTIEHKTLNMDGRSRIPKDFYVVNLKRRWFLLYCLQHSYLLVAEPIK